MKRYQFTTVGNGHFPLSMLQEDECWPADTVSALAISLGATPQPKLITLASHRLPNSSNWEKCGWPISNLFVTNEE